MSRKSLFILAIGGLVLAVATYLALIPWDTTPRPAYPGSIDEVSPVGTGEVVAFSLVLGAGAAVFGWLRAPRWLSLLCLCVPPSALEMLSAATHPGKDANLWPIGWAVWTVALVIGVLVVGELARYLRSRRTRRQ